MTKSRRAARTKAEKPKAESTPLTQALSQGHDANVEKVSKPSRTGDTVTVGCKLPNGLVLQLQTRQMVRYPVMGGGFHEEEQMRPDPNLPSHTLFGNRVPFGAQPKCLVVGGFAMTPGIPADFMDRWMDQNKNLDVVKSGLIIVHSTTDRARGEATEKKNLRSGLEAIRPGDDVRIPKRAVKGKIVDAIETGDEQPAAA